MSLKYKVANIAEVPEALREMYEKVGEEYILQVDGAADKGKLDEFRNNNIELLKKLETYKGIDPKKFIELTELERQKNEKELIEAGKVEEVIATRVKTLKESHDQTLAQINGQLTTANSQLELLLIDNAVKSAALSQGVLPVAIEDVVLRAKSAFKIHEGKPLVRDAKGEVVYGDDGVTPLSVEGWTKGLKKQAPHLFAGFNGSGASGSGGVNGAGGERMTALDKISQGMSAH